MICKEEYRVLTNENFSKVLVKFINYAVILAGIFLFFRYLFFPLLPFVLSLFITALIRPAVLFVSKKTGLPIKLSVVLFTLALISVLFALVYISFSRLLSELVSFAYFVSGEEFSAFVESICGKVIEVISKLSGNKLSDAQLSVLSDKIQSFDFVVTESVKELLPKLLSKIGSFLSAFPSAVLFLVIMFVSLFYIGCDYERISAFLARQFSDKTLNNVREIKKVFLSTIKELFKAYFLITFITFSQLLAGFLVLDVKYAILLALVVSLVDMLPVLGTGTVLVPWAVFCYITGDVPRCVGLLVVYAIITLVRQIAEPKIVGSAVGLSPLVTLISMYLGIKLIGFAGLFIFPICAMVLKSLNDKNIIKIYKTDTDKVQKSKELKAKAFKSYKEIK